LLTQVVGGELRLGLHSRLQPERDCGGHPTRNGRAGQTFRLKVGNSRKICHARAVRMLSMSDDLAPFPG
jgi:hypothetical protein